MSSDRNFTSQRMEIINTVSEVFNITAEEYKLIEGFISHTGKEDLDLEDLIFAQKKTAKKLEKAMPNP